MEFNFRNFFISAVCVAAVGGVGYAVYFDYKRRNDQSFRKDLKKKKKAVEKEKESEAKEIQTSVADAAKNLTVLFKTIKEEPIPESQEEREAYLFHHLNEGEVLANRGPAYFEQSAGHIFRAICCCPNPLELVMLVEKMLPKGCYEIVVGLFTLEIKAKQLEFLEYYNEYPPSEMNVKLVEDPNQPMLSESDPIKKYNLIAEKDFSINEVIYTEKPIISVLYPGLEGHNFCSACLKVISSKPVRSPYKHINSVFCSASCLSASEDEFPASVAGKEMALNVFKDAREQNVMIPSLMSRILNRIFKEHERQLSSKKNVKYTAMQHVERFIAAEVKTPQHRLQEETKLVQEYLSVNTEGVDQVVTVEYYSGMKGKLIKGSFGVVSAPEHPDVVSVSKVNEGIRSVAPGLATGCGVYVTSTYLKDGLFEANTQAEFRNNDHTLTLVSTKPIKKGDILIVASFNTTNATISKTESTTKAQGSPPLTQGNKKPDSLAPQSKQEDSSIPTYAEAVAESALEPVSEAKSKIDFPSYADIAAEAPASSDKDSKIINIDQVSDTTPSYDEVAAKAPIKPKEVLEADSKNVDTEASLSYAKIAAEAPDSSVKDVKMINIDQSPDATLSCVEAAVDSPVKSEKNLDKGSKEADIKSSSYAAIAAEAPASTDKDSKIINIDHTSESTSSHVNVAAEAPVSPKIDLKESNAQASESTMSYASVAAEGVDISDNVIFSTDITSSQEFEKIEPIENEDSS